VTDAKIASTSSPGRIQDYGPAMRIDCFPPGAERGRFIGLDALRGLAITLVLFGHFTYRIPDDTIGRPLIFAIHQLGYVGADIFMVLSGFLIGGMLLTSLRTTGRIGAMRFLGRRALRLWPSYFLVILLAWKWSHWVGAIDEYGHRAPPVNLWNMWPMALHIQNYFDLLSYKQGGASVALHTWTLMVLIHFYVLFAGLMLLIAQRPRTVHLIPWLVGFIAIVCFVIRLRVAPIDEEHFDAYRQYFPTHVRIDEPMFGVLLAYWTLYRRDAVDWIMHHAWPLVILLSVAVLIPMAVRQQTEPPSWCIWGYTVAALSAGGLIMTFWWLEQRRRAAPAPCSPVRRLARLPLQAVAMVGLWSYSIYLWHQPFCNQFLVSKIRNTIGTHVINWSSRWNYPATALAFIVASIAVGAVMFYLVERPSLWWRRKILPPATISPTQAPPDLSMDSRRSSAHGAGDWS